MTATTSPPVNAPVLDDDPFGPEVLSDPHAFHRKVRDSGPVVYLSRHDIFALGRYQDVHAALTDWQSFQSGAGVGITNFRYEKPWRPPSLLLEADPPLHDAPRSVLARILSTQAIRKLRDGWFEEAEAFVDEIVGRRELDAMHDIAEVFPLRIFPDAVGIPKAGREQLLPYGNHLFNTFGPDNENTARGVERIGAISEWVNAQCDREVLTDQGFGADIWAAAKHGDISDEQAPLVVRSLLSAGVDTTVHALAAMLFCFASNPVQWSRLRENPSLARIAFDEAIRLESPVQTFFRTTTSDLRVGGTLIPDGSKVLLFLGSANRDERVWERPEEFDLSRNPSGHVGFGMGIHQCVGQHVARLEAEALLTAMARRITSIEPAGPEVRVHNNTVREWGSIPVRLRTS